MVAGYLVHATQGAWASRHNPQHFCFYNEAAAKWYIIADDGSGSDFFLWEYDGSTPTNPGDAGGWAKIRQIEDRDTGIPDCFWDEANQKLHVLSWHATAKYSVFAYASGAWTGTVIAAATGETVGGTHSTMPSGAYAVETAIGAGTQRIWVAYYDNAFLLKTRVRTNGSDDPANTWQQDATIEGAAPSGTEQNRVAMCKAVIGGVDCICCFYSFCEDSGTAAGEWRFAYRAESAALGSAWTTELVDDTQAVDDHATVASVVLAGDTNATILAVGKDHNNDILVWKRSAVGVWSSVSKITGTFTRPRIAIDRTNEKAYIVYTNDGVDDEQINYVVSPINALSWSAAANVLEVATATLNDAILPNHNVTSISNLLIGATQSLVGVWWAFLDIPAAGKLHFVASGAQRYGSLDGGCRG
jgi:hypothetical protein